jgi:NCS2 family nucleobase:cation symporter-2
LKEEGVIVRKMNGTTLSGITKQAGDGGEEGEKTVRRKPSHLIYGVDDAVPLPTRLVLGLQHSLHVMTGLVFAMIIIQGMNGSGEQAGFFISMSLLAGGIATILQALNRKGIGSGYFAPSTCDPGYISATLLAAKTGGLPLVFGMTALSGCCEMALSRVIQHMRRVFTPEVMGLVVAMVGISIIPVSLRNFLGIDSAGQTINPAVFTISCITLGVMASITVWSRGKLRLFSVIIGMASGYLLSYFAGLMPEEHIQRIIDKPFVAVPDFGMLEWSFDTSLILPFLIASLCSSVKTLGNLTTCQKMNDADWKRPDMMNIRKGLLADGMGMGISGLIGGMGQSTASSNIGLAMGTGATSRQIAFTAGCILISLAFFPKIVEVFVVMPRSVMGATPLFAVCFIIMTGFQIMMSRMIDPRKIFILGISLIFGFGAAALVQVFAGIQNPWIRPLVASSLYLSTVLAICLTLVFSIGSKKRHREVVRAGETSYEDINRLMEEQGAIWGARQEVINRAISALNELVELIAALDLTRKEMQLDMRFDELSIDFTLEYEGRPLDLSQDQSAVSSIDEDVSIARLALRLIRKDVDRITTSERGGKQRVLLHLDH